MMRRKTIDIGVGVFVTVGFAAVAFLSLKVAGANTFTSGATYQVQAKFDNIGGLKVRAPVKSAGVVVGRVGAIAFDNESFGALVTMQLERRYQFPRDSSAKVLTTGLLGEQYLGLSAGGDTANLAQGDTLKITQSAIVLENLISQFLFSKAAETNDKKQP